MKCEHCGKNEVSFVYKSNINGKVEEKHLCQECAEKLGYTQRLFAQNRQMMDDFFGRNSLLGGGSLLRDSFFDDFFTPLPSLMGRMLENPLDDFFADMPALGSAPAKQQEAAGEEKKDDLVSQEEQSRFAYLRKVNALKLEQKKAIHAQDFERAAEIRDELRRMEEARNGEQKSA